MLFAASARFVLFWLPQCEMNEEDAEMYRALQVGGWPRLLVTSPPVSTRLSCAACLLVCLPCLAFMHISCLSTGIDKRVSQPILTPLLLAPACAACPALPALQTELRVNYRAILQKMHIDPNTLGGASG
jgi:hypothetical protein